MSNHKNDRQSQTNSDKSYNSYNTYSTYPTQSNQAKLTSLLDTSIQNSLSYFTYADYPSDKIEVPNEVAKLLTSYKSFTPDLVIFNKKFNKNECFLNANTSYNNPYPRYKFYINENSNSGKGKQSYGGGGSSYKDSGGGGINSREKDDYYENEVGYNTGGIMEEEDPQWLDCKVEEFNESKVSFQALPKNNKIEQIPNVEKDEGTSQDKIKKIVTHEEKSVPIIKGDKDLNRDLMKQLESFFEEDKVDKVEENKIKLQPDKPKLDEKPKAIETKPIIIDNPNWSEKLSLFKQHYDPENQIQKEVNNKKQELEKIKAEADINHFTDLMNKFKNLQTIQSVPIEAKQPHQDTSKAHNEHNDSSHSIEDNLSHLKNLLNDKDYDDKEDHNDSYEEPTQKQDAKSKFNIAM